VTGADFTALLPLIVIAAAAIAVMLGIAIRRNHFASALISGIGLACAFGTLRAASRVAPRQVTALLVIDSYALFYTGLMIAATLVVVILSYTYMERHAVHSEELYILLLVGLLGSSVLVSSSHFVALFLGLEVLSIPLYGMTAYLRGRARSLEAGIKYLTLAAASAAFLLFGIALVYAELGTMSFPEIARRLSAAEPGVLLLAGLALIVTGIGFKLAVVPFHLWTPDVYEGAPAPVSAFVATVSKGGMLGLLVRYFYESGSGNLPAVFDLFATLAVASMLVGNLLALFQNNVKRILAYSSISHLGYMLVAFLAGGEQGARAITFYLVAYFVTILGAFGVVAEMSGEDPARDADQIADFQGLFWRRPALAGVFSAMLLSLAGIPLTAGFYAKFYVVAAGASSAIWALLVILVVTSAIGLFYYLRILVAMYDRVPRPMGELSRAGAAVLALLTGLLFWFGVYPSPLLAAIRNAVAGLM
jgi:NADH-quinone oxidoreductase subunit N